MTKLIKKYQRGQIIQDVFLKNYKPKTTAPKAEPQFETTEEFNKRTKDPVLFMPHALREYHKKVMGESIPYNLIDRNSIFTVDNDTLRNTVGFDKNVNWDNMNTILKVLKNRGFTKDQALAFATTAAVESYANPGQQQIVNGKPTNLGLGLFQYDGDRQKDFLAKVSNYKDLVSQLDYVIDTIKTPDGKLHWNRGDYDSWKTPYTIYNDKNRNLQDYVRSLTYGYTRPKDTAKQTAHRYKLAQNLAKYIAWDNL